MQGAFRDKKGAKCMRVVFTTRVRPKGLDRGGELSADHGSEKTVNMNQLTPMMHKIYTRETSTVINKQHNTDYHL